MRVVVRVNMSSITKSPHQEFKLCPWIFDQVQQRDLAKLINSKSNNFTVKKQSVFRLHTSSKTWVVEAEGNLFFFVVCLLLLLSRFSCVRLCVTPQTAAIRLPHLWDSPGKNTGVGCHLNVIFILYRGIADLQCSVGFRCTCMRLPLVEYQLYARFSARPIQRRFRSPLPRIPWDALNPSSRDQGTARVRTSSSEPWHTLMHNALELGKISHY